MMRKEIIRGIILHTGLTPEKIDLEKVKPKMLPDKKWLEYLKNSFNED